MIYTPLVKKAMNTAYRAHHGQKDQSGVPYIFHPFYVAEALCNVMPEEAPVCAALLYDVVEDTDITLEELEREFPEEVVRIVALLTHTPGEDYFAYIQRLKKDPVARQIKIMDLHHNMDESRLDGCTNVTDNQKKWRRRKYEKALDMLMCQDT